MYFYELISLKYMIKVIKKSKCLLITTALITLVSMQNRSEKKLYILYIIQYYNNQFHIIKKKLHLFIPIKKKITELPYMPASIFQTFEKDSFSSKTFFYNK